MPPAKAQTAPLHDKSTAANFLTGFPKGKTFDFQLARGHERSNIVHGALEEFGRPSRN